MAVNLGKQPFQYLFENASEPGFLKARLGFCSFSNDAITTENAKYEFRKIDLLGRSGAQRT